MGFKLDGVIKGVLYNKDGTVDYVFDDVKLDEVIAPFENETDAERNQDKTLFLSSSNELANLCRKMKRAQFMARRNWRKGLRDKFKVAYDDIEP